MSLSVPRIALKSAKPTITFVRNSGGGHFKFSSYRHDLVTGVRAPAESAKLFKKISAFAVLPILFTLYLGYQDEENVHHAMPKWKENHREYPFRYIRRREFPWGDGNHTLIFRPNQFIPGEGFPEGHDDHH
uniref:Uncharacterized protein n=1 Tax=Acrobeloides nanus TaxID=290746 RepID=A0A914BW38_9BILA